MTGLRVPGDKSIAHRAIMLAGLAEGTSRVRNVPDGLDVIAVTIETVAQHEANIRIIIDDQNTPG